MTATIQIGADNHGAPVAIDIEELLATRLLVQGNSGSGKSHLLRRLLEESAHIVQQIVVDPEGDFVSLAGIFDHVIVDGAAYSPAELTRLAARIRGHRASVVLTLEGLEVEAQMRCAALFLSALFDAPREHWFPAIVAVDEAQLFAPAAAGDVSDEARRLSLAAMTNLMCRGRKRGLAGIVATQRLAKLAKNVAAEASNFLMGRTFLDIDMARAADLLGMERRQAEQIRDLERGRFLGLGPAISRRPISIKIGPVRTGSSTMPHALAPLPDRPPAELHSLLHDGLEIENEPARAPAPPAPSPDMLIEGIVGARTAPPEIAAPVPSEPGPDGGTISQIVSDIAAQDGVTFQQPAALFQDFSFRCRMQAIDIRSIDIRRFRRLFALAVAGVPDPEISPWREVTDLSEALSEDVLTPFLVIAKAAIENAPCPDDDALARAYGTNSLGRIRRLLDHFERQSLISVRTDFSGRRTVTIPALGLATAPVES